MTDYHQIFAALSQNCLQEYFIADLIELLKLAPYFPEVHAALESMPLEELIMFLIAFMPASAFINNIYLRAQLGEVLIPQIFGQLAFTLAIKNRDERKTNPVPGFLVYWHCTAFTSTFNCC